MDTNRRQFLHPLGLSAAFFTARGAFAAALQQTPNVGFGPFYPDHVPLEHPEWLEVEFKPVVGWKAGELAAKFDLVMGLTPAM